ncbi:MAG: hypothetical protein HOU01_00770 [Streptomycetaceae bacterium]|nr:hypothetical protein [Streptomycetaceae bacterium]
MAKELTAEDTARLLERAARRRSDGSRGMRARHAWRRLVQACGEGSSVAQDEVRGMAAGLPESDVLELLAAAPEEPADRAAYLALIGQTAQREALDPDGSLLALAYRAATGEVRTRLRTVMAAEGDAEVIRVVVTGEQRDRIAELSYDELDYLGRHFAEHQRWDELRRLARDLPLDRAVAAAALLPEHERTGGHAELLTALAGHSGRQLRSLAERLPQRRVIRWDTHGYVLRASFAPDGSEVALSHQTFPEAFVRGEPRPQDEAGEHIVDMLRLGTGVVERRFVQRLPEWYQTESSVLHVGNEVLVRWGHAGRYSVACVVPDHRVICTGAAVSDLRRASTGAVLIGPDGLAFADRGASALRYVAPPRGGTDLRTLVADPAACVLATLPAFRRIACYDRGKVHVVREDGEVLHTIVARGEARSGGVPRVVHPALSFLSPDAVALYLYDPGFGHGKRSGQHTGIWEFPPGGTARHAASHQGSIRDRWPLEEWRGRPLDDTFAARLLTSVPDSRADNGQFGPMDDDVPWLHGLDKPGSGGPGTTSAAARYALAVAPGGDTLVTATGHPLRMRFEVHSPHLPTARELLERPLAHGGPRDLQRVRELLATIGDPAVRAALELLEFCLAERLGLDIALGDTSGVTPASTDIALGDARSDHDSDVHPRDVHRRDARA